MWSLRHRLTRNLLLLFGVLVGTALFAAATLVSYALRRTLDTDLKARAAAMRSLTEINHGRVDLDFSPDFLRSYAAHDSPQLYFELWDQSGRSLARSPSLGDLHLPHPESRPDRHHHLANVRLPNHHSGRVLELEYLPELETPAETPQRVFLALAIERGPLNQELLAVWGAAAAGSLLALVLIALLVPRVLRHGLRSLDSLSLLTQDVDAETLATRFPSERQPTELQPITAALNELLRRLEISFARERRFNADLAHELRTPIAELRNSAECALKWPDSREQTHDRDTLDIALQMEALVDRMVTLARLEAGEGLTPKKVFALAELVHDVGQSFAPAAAQRGLTLVQAITPASVVADEVLARIILQNLWDNAVEHALAPGEIDVRGEFVAGSYRFAIGNRTNLSQAKLAHLFDRFWRNDPARGDALRHSGLGLNLARTAAARMGWALTADLTPDSQIVFNLTIPEAKAVASDPVQTLG